MKYRDLDHAVKQSLDLLKDLTDSIEPDAEIGTRTIWYGKTDLKSALRSAPLRPGVVIGKTPPLKTPPFTGVRVGDRRFLIWREMQPNAINTTMYLGVRCISMTQNPFMTLTLTQFYLA